MIFQGNDPFEFGTGSIEQQSPIQDLAELLRCGGNVDLSSLIIIFG